MVRPKLPASCHPSGSVFASEIFRQSRFGSETDDVMKRGIGAKLLIGGRIKQAVDHVQSHPTAGRVGARRVIIVIVIEIFSSTEYGRV